VIDIKFIKIKKINILFNNKALYFIVHLEFILKIIFTKITKNIKLFLKSTVIPLGIGVHYNTT
jgi:hypothetical protein